MELGGSVDSLVLDEWLSVVFLCSLWVENHWPCTVFIYSRLHECLGCSKRCELPSKSQPPSSRLLFNTQDVGPTAAGVYHLPNLLGLLSSSLLVNN